MSRAREPWDPAMRSRMGNRKSGINTVTSAEKERTEEVESTGGWGGLCS